MKQYVTSLSAVAIVAILTGCGGGGGGGNGLSGAVPPTNQTNITSDVLQVAVGTAFNANDAPGFTGLNVVPTFRQSSGLSAVLANTPTLLGPATFQVPAGFEGAYAGTNLDAGTSNITASAQTNAGTTPTNTTLGTFTGVFSYGFAPVNSDTTSGSNGYYPGNPNATTANGFLSSNFEANAYGATACGSGCDYNPTGSLAWWPQPIGDTTYTALGVYLIGPPAVPFFNNGTYPGSFAGYSPGFTAFEVAPGVGTYTLNDAVTIANAPSKSFSATSNKLTNVAPLAAPVVSGVTENGGGLTGTVTIGADPRITETLVFIQDANPGNPGASPPQAERNFFYTVGPITGTGAQTFTLPAMLGPCFGVGCQTSATTQTPSIVVGDTYIITAISFDYPAFEDGPPGNRTQSPTLTGAAGQTDLSIGVALSTSYL